jgi:hypothetical protein
MLILILAFAGMAVVLIVAFLFAAKQALIVALVASIVAFIIGHFWKTSTPAATKSKRLKLVGGVFAVVILSVVFGMIRFINDEFAPTREITSKEKEIAKLMARINSKDRFSAAIKIADSGKTDEVTRRLYETVVDAFATADYQQEDISDEDLEALENAHAKRRGPSPATRSCQFNKFSATLYLKRSGPADVYQTIGQYPANAKYCPARSQYIESVLLRCHESGLWRGRCAKELPLEQLATLRSDPDVGEQIIRLLARQR